MAISLLLIAAAVVFAAAIIRGYSGFGFSMICAVSLSQVLPPIEVVPLILLLEVAASIWLLPGVWPQIHWPSLAWLFAGVVVGSPLGLHLLANVPARPMRAFIALVVMAMVIGLWRGLAFQRMPGRGRTTAVGIISGVLNGATTIGGPPVILFYLATPAGVVVSRASLIAYFLIADLLAFGIALNQGMVTSDTIYRGGLLVVPLTVGLVVGRRCFSQSSAEALRRKVLLLLTVLSGLALIRAIGFD